jgi:hypothetical protein
VASDCQKEAGTFIIEVDQYISCFKAAKANSEQESPKHVTRFFCSFPDSPKYKSGKPVPWNKRYVAVSGFLSGATYTKEDRSLVEYFKITTENISFLGQHMPVASSNASQTSESS